MLTFLPCFLDFLGMVRPVSYQPTTAFKLSDAEIAKYKKIAADAKVACLERRMTR